MAAKGKAFHKAQRSVQGFAAILKSAACEWFLIFLMLIDALLSYVLTKLARSCNLQTPCILCSRLDHLLGKENPHNYRNLLCTNHRLEISSLVSCYKHNKLVDGNEMCDACLCSFASTNNKPRFNSKMQKLRLHTGGNGARGKLLKRDSIPHCIKTRPCSCCSKPWKTRPNAQGMLQLKSSVNMATKTKIPYPRCLNSPDSFKQTRDKIFGSVTLQYPGKTGFNLLSHVGYSELRITSDSELEDVLPEEDDDKSLIYEKSELTEHSLLQSITQIPLEPHCNDYDQVKPSINFVDSRPSSLESHVQVDVQKPHDVTSLACDANFHGLSELNWLPWPDNPIANPSTWAELISLDDASSPASNVLGLYRANSMEKSELTDSLNQESPLSCSPEFITLHHDPQIVGKLATSEETRTDSMEIASLDHSELISTKVEMFCDSDSGSSKSDEKHANHKSDSESSDSDKKNTNHDSDSESSDSDKKNTDHNSDSESSKSIEEHEVNFNAKQSFEKEIDIGTNDLKQPPLISTTAAECSKTGEEVYKSAIKNVSDGMDHSSASEQEVFDCSVGQSLKNESDLVVNDLKQSPLISTIVEECPKIDEVVYVSDNRNTIDDMNHIGLSESSESDKEQENVNFSIEQSSEKETDIVTNDLKQCPLISTTVEECPKTNEGFYEYAIKNTNDDMDHDNISESSENGNEYEIFNFATRQSLEKETDIVTQVTYESAIKNTNDDMNHSNVDESFESDKQQDVLNCATGQPLETGPDRVSTDMEQFSMQNSPVGLVNQSSSDDEGHNFSISDDDLEKESSGEFNIIRALDRSASMESVESLDGSNVSEIEGENMVDKLKRQVEYDKKCMNSLYKELEEERNASEVAASQAMAMITRLQEEKAAMKMDSLHYLRMMEEQAEYDVEALEKANELLNEREREIQELETELEYYRSNYLMDTIVESEHEQSDGANEEDTIAEHHEYTANYSFKSTIAEASKGSNRSLNNQTSSLEFEDEKVYIQLCLKRLEDKINKIFANRLLPRLPNCIDTEEEARPEQIGEGSEENGPSIHKITCNGRVTAEEEFGSEQNFGNVKVEVSCGDKRGGEEIDFLSLANKISELTGRLEAVQADYDFLEHSLSSLRYGEEGLQFAYNIVHQLHELCKLGIRLDPQSAS